MAYRVPLFGFRHAAQAAGLAAVTPDNVDAAYPKERLIDGLVKRPFKFGAVNVNHTIDVDLGAGFVAGLDRLLIPAGHDVGGQGFTVEQDDNSGFTTPTTLATGTFPAGTATIDVALAGHTERFVRLTIAPSGRWSLPEMWYTTRRVTARGPEANWTDQFVPNVAETTLRAGERYGQKNGPRRRQFSFSYVHLTDVERDLFEQLLDATSDGATPFWFWPPDDAEPPVLVHLSALIPIVQDRENPRATAQAWGITVAMLESLA